MTDAAPPQDPFPRPPAAPRKRRKHRRKPKARPHAQKATLAPNPRPKPGEAGPPPPKVNPSPTTHPRRDKPVGQIPKLTPEVQKAVCDAIAATSLSFDDACRLAGINPGTGHMWLQRGTGEHKDRRPEPRYVEFVEAVARARARDKAARVARMTQAAIGGYEVSRETITRPDGTRIERVRKQPPEWRADESILERRYPDEFGRRITVQQEGAGTPVDWAGMVQEAWAMIRADQAKRVGPRAPAALPAPAANYSRRNGEEAPS